MKTFTYLIATFIIGYFIIAGALFLKSGADAASANIERNTSSITTVLKPCGLENAIGAKC